MAGLLDPVLVPHSIGDGGPAHLNMVIHLISLVLSIKNEFLTVMIFFFRPEKDTDMVRDEGGGGGVAGAAAVSRGGFYI